MRRLTKTEKEDLQWAQDHDERPLWPVATRERNRLRRLTYEKLFAMGEHAEFNLTLLGQRAATASRLGKRHIKCLAQHEGAPIVSRSNYRNETIAALLDMDLIETGLTADGMYRYTITDKGLVVLAILREWDRNNG